MFIFAHPILYTMIRSYTKKTFSFILALVVSSLTAMGQNAIDGTWHGELEISGQKLMLVFHLDPEGSSIDSPDQMAYNIPADIMESSPTKVKVEIPSLNAGFEGSMMFGLLIGKFRQNGLEFPLSLKHGNPEMKRPQTPAPPFAYQNEAVTFTNPYDGALLSGTLAIPQDHSHDTPVILLVSGSGLGQLAIQYGLYRFNKPMMYMSSLFLIVLVQIMQEGISAVAKRTDKRIR
jgi:hypothetical protein